MLNKVHCLTLFFLTLTVSLFCQKPDTRKIDFLVQLGGIFHSPKVQKEYGNPQSQFEGFNSRFGYDANISLNWHINNYVGLKTRIGTSLQGRKQDPDIYNHFMVSSAIGPCFQFKKWEFYSLFNGQYLVKSNDSLMKIPSSDRFFQYKSGDIGYVLGLNYDLIKRVSVGVEFTNTFSPYYTIDLQSEVFKFYRRNIGVYFSFSL